MHYEFKLLISHDVGHVCVLRSDDHSYHVQVVLEVYLRRGEERGRSC